LSWEIPLTDVVIEQEDLDAVAECLRSGWLTMGPRTKQFEDAVAEYTGSPHAVAVSSGTAALHLACAALDLQPGDEVIVPAFTFLATANAPRYRGATPVLCDVVSPHAPSIDPQDVVRRITAKTKAVIAVHMCGYRADMEALRAICTEHGLALIEDSAQGFGIPPTGDLTCLSFFSKKQLAVGEGGMVLTPNGDLAAKVRLLRSHAMTSGTWDRHRGHEDSYDVVDIGFNFRLDEPRAALGLSRLRRVADEIERRRAAVRAYRERLAEYAMWDDTETATHFAFTVLFESQETRIAVREALAQQRIQTTRYPALHHLTEFAQFGANLPNAEQAALRHLALPLSAYTTLEQVDRVSQAVLEAVERASSRTRP
jgi:dTDP-4-amino-4,6-dideoxygalactose transaminase